MSDIDADLYGDLYETDFADQAADDKLETKQQSKPEAPAAASVDIENQALKPVTTADISSNPVQSPPSTQTSITPVVQQIPTYEDPSSSGYRDSTPVRQGSYQNIPISEQRSVRPSEMKDDGKMFIGGLNWDTTDEGLRAYFEQFGNVDACTIMRDQAGRSRCFAFLTFEDPASVNAVMVKEHVLDGKIIDPKRAIPRQEHQRATKLFIGGLAGTVTSESMRAFFSQFGRVIDSTVMLDRDTGRSKGFGFVSLEDSNIQQYLGFGNLEIDGKLIDIKLAQPRYQREHFQEDQPSGSDGFNNRATGFSSTTNLQSGGNPAGNFSAGAAGASSGSPFDPSALAALYTRMFQMANVANGAMNPMMTGMNPMVAMRNNMMAGGTGMQGGAGMGNMAGGAGMGMGRGGMPGGSGGQNIPRGPRGNSNSGMGPARSQRGQHNYHPYGR